MVAEPQELGSYWIQFRHLITHIGIPGVGQQETKQSVSAYPIFAVYAESVNCGPLKTQFNARKVSTTFFRLRSAISTEDFRQSAANRVGIFRNGTHYCRWLYLTEQISLFLFINEVRNVRVRSRDDLGLHHDGTEVKMLRLSATSWSRALRFNYVPARRFGYITTLSIR